MNIKDKATGEVIGTVITNHSMTFDEAMDFAGFVWHAEDGECGWTKDDAVTLWDEESAEMDYETA